MNTKEELSDGNITNSHKRGNRKNERVLFNEKGLPRLYIICDWNQYRASNQRSFESEMAGCI